MYKGKLAASLVNPDAWGTLLLALQADDIRAIKDHKEMHPDEWAEATKQSWPPHVHFRRTDVLQKWPASKRYRSLKVSHEKAAIENLSQWLAADTTLRRTPAYKRCLKIYPKLGPRVFRERIWPPAREAAGLPRKASPGAPSKSAR